MSKNKKAGVYKITNIINNKLYVGSSADLMKRKWHHFKVLKEGTHKNIHLQRAYDTYGYDNFQWEILEFVDFIEDKKEFKTLILSREQYWLDTLIIVDGKSVGYNINLVAGSSLGTKLSEETKRKLSLKSRNPSDETRRKLSESSKGRQTRLGSIVSVETREKMSISQLGKHSGPKHDEEARKKISEAGKGRIQSEETRQKRRESMMGKNKGKIMSDEAKLKLSESLKGKTSWMKGKTHTEESKQKIRESLKLYSNGK